MKANGTARPGTKIDMGPDFYLEPDPISRKPPKISVKTELHQNSSITSSADSCIKEIRGNIFTRLSAKSQLSVRTSYSEAGRHFSLVQTCIPHHVEISISDAGSDTCFEDHDCDMNHDDEQVSVGEVSGLEDDGGDSDEEEEQESEDAVQEEDDDIDDGSTSNGGNEEVGIEEGEEIIEDFDNDNNAQ